MVTSRFIDRKTQTTIKIVCCDLELTSKLSAFLDSVFREDNALKPRIMVSDSDHSYYFFSNKKNETIRVALQQISPYASQSKWLNPTEAQP